MEEKKSRQISKRSLYREEIKEALMDAIVSGELAPGERIVETRWARELGVSQSPIREAIRELELIGLVENIPYKGCIVRKLTSKDIVDTYKIRIALETMAVCEAVHHDMEELLPKMKEALVEMEEGANQGDMRRFIEADVSFHEAYVETSENMLLKRLWQQCYIRDTTRLSTLISPESLIKLAKRHKQIHQAIEDKDEELATEAIKMHFGLLIEDINRHTDS